MVCSAIRRIEHDESGVVAPLEASVPRQETVRVGKRVGTHQEVGNHTRAGAAALAIRLPGRAELLQRLRGGFR